MRLLGPAYAESSCWPPHSGQASQSTPGHEGTGFFLGRLHRYGEALPILDYGQNAIQEIRTSHQSWHRPSPPDRWRTRLSSFERARRLTPDDWELLKNIEGRFSACIVGRCITVLLEAIEKHPDDYVEAIVLLAKRIG